MSPSSWWEGILPEKLRWLISPASSTIYEREVLPARTQKYWHYALLMGATHNIKKVSFFWFVYQLRQTMWDWKKAAYNRGKYSL